jgi:protein involved in polysaccharide export with SLBB domain
MERLKSVVLTISAVIFLISCASPVVKNPTPISRDQRPYSTDEYRIQIGDVLDVKFYYNPELNDSVTVRPDGRISLQLAPEVMAAGITPIDLAGQLRERYRSELRNPQVTVIVRSFGSQRMFVDGEVGAPGLVTLTGPLTVMQAIAESGGFKDTARYNEVLVIRRTAAKKPHVMTINLENAINGTDLGQDIFVLPFDIVYVPKSPIANVNVWVDQYIRKMIPIPFGFGWTI